MKIKTCALECLALDWAVAKAEGIDFAENGWNPINVFLGARVGGHHRYSEDWACGGPIIGREAINLRMHSGTVDRQDIAFVWVKHQPAFRSLGPTPLIAAMRCYVVSKLGNEVEIPEELV